MSKTPSNPQKLPSERKLRAVWLAVYVVLSALPLFLMVCTIDVHEFLIKDATSPVNLFNPLAKFQIWSRMFWSKPKNCKSAGKWSIKSLRSIHAFLSALNKSLANLRSFFVFPFGFIICYKFHIRGLFVFPGFWAGGISIFHHPWGDSGRGNKALGQWSGGQAGGGEALTFSGLYLWALSKGSSDDIRKTSCFVSSNWSQTLRLYTNLGFGSYIWTTGIAKPVG